MIEHMGRKQALNLCGEYLRFVRRVAGLSGVSSGTRLCLRPHALWFAQDKDLAELVGTLGPELERSFRFPFPRKAGRLFTHAELCVTARTPS